MLTEYPYARHYLFTALKAQPELFERALHELTSDEADRRPDPDRFSIREVMAHLAEWEGIWLERMKRICAEDHPTLPGYDEGAFARDHDYASKDPFEQVRLFREGREKLVAFLGERVESDWQRTALRQEIGVLTLEALTLIIPLHDIYHLQQVQQWRAAE
jgi:hypothetical protein